MTNNPTRIQFPSNEDVVLLGKISENTKYSTVILMAKLSEKNKEILTTNGYLTIKSNEKVFSIDANDIYLYGNISSKEDYDELKALNFKWCNDIHHGSFIPANYDYETNTGEGYLNNKNKLIPNYVETFDNIKMFQFGHARLGKPKEVIIFKQLYKTLS